jgi:hypothetical protein
VKDDNIYCYFLGDGVRERNLALEFAKKYHLKVVTIPYLNNHYRKCDIDYGDIRLSKISPNAFLSLIKYANYIFTDSFHGTVFSGIFNRHFVTFGRNDFVGMDERIESLLEMFNAEKCFCNSEERITLTYIEDILSETIEYETEILKDKIKFSQGFLEEELI